MAPNQPDWKMGSQKGLLEDVTTQGSPEGIKGATEFRGWEGLQVKGIGYAKTKDGGRMNMGFFCNTRRKWSAREGVVLGKTRVRQELDHRGPGCLNI